MSHRIILRGLGVPTRAGGPLLVQRTDDDFVANVFEECRDPALIALLKTRAADTDAGGMLRLFQPVHRAYHLALFEAVCDRPGEPRLDPASITGAGMVIRRIASARGSGAFGEAWRDDGVKTRRWEPFPTAGAVDLDPAPALRTLPDQGRPEINELLRAVVRGDEIAEEVITLFPLPPAVCGAAGRTILFGLVPTVSAQVESQSDAPADPYDPDDIAEQLPPFLRAGKPPSIDELADQRFSYESADELAHAAARSDHPAVRAKQMFGFLAMLKTLAIQLDAFGESADAGELRKRLAAIPLAFAAAPKVRTAAEHLAEAADVLVMSPGTGRTIAMPSTWPQIAPGTAEAIRKAFGKVLQARFAAFAPRATRFDDPRARYQIRGFVRVRRDDGCPPELWWSEPGVPYQIAPWYENGVGPPVLIRLPKLDRENIKKLKPNVSFVVPRSLFGLLGRNSPKDFLEGNAKEGPPAGGLDWICGFNIPIITICAFIILFIFLTLLNIIFFWLPFVRICFPIPRNAKELVP